MKELILTKEDYLAAKESALERRREALLILELTEATLELVNKRLKMFPEVEEEDPGEDKNPAL